MNVSQVLGYNVSYSYQYILDVAVVAQETASNIQPSGVRLIRFLDLQISSNLCHHELILQACMLIATHRIQAFHNEATETDP
jgi:hypothetical protein